MNRMPRLSSIEVLILRLLVSSRELYGLEMVEASNGHLKRGTVYVTLSRMENKGYITSRQEKTPPSAPGIPRRLYKLTADGKRVLAAWEAAEARWSEGFA